MKKISAIICELNPLHDGHRYVFNAAKTNSDVLVAVMSGNFVQRGETAVYHKYKRAEMALSAGANIVVELPFPFSSSSAEYVARAGVTIAEGIGADTLYFGSESGDIDALKKCAKVLASDEYRNAMTVGRSAKLRADAIKTLAPDLPESLLSSPNDILGAEYCRFATINTVPVKRISTDSASIIRKRELQNSDTDMLDPKRLFELEFNHFRSLRSLIGGIAECGGGVAERLYKTAFESKNASEWIENVKTKQYTDARLRRAALYSLCSVTTNELSMPCSFTNLLGADSVGTAYLSSIRKSGNFPIITNNRDKRFLDNDSVLQYELSMFADSIYALCMRNADPALFIKTQPVICG